MGKRHKPEEIITELRQVDVLVSQCQACRTRSPSIGVIEVTYYHRRQIYGGATSVGTPMRLEYSQKPDPVSLENAIVAAAIGETGL